MIEELPGIAALAVMAVVALWLTISRGGVRAKPGAVRSTTRVAVLAVAAQTVHFTEELATGFHERLPGAFGLAPLSLSLFVAFNLAWLVIWFASVWGIARRLSIALFPLWFLGVAGVVNGIAHPLLALGAGGYFPGLATSPIVAVACALLLSRLVRATA
jgi:hypothetical protein